MTFFVCEIPTRHISDSWPIVQYKSINWNCDLKTSLTFWHKHNYLNWESSYGVRTKLSDSSLSHIFYINIFVSECSNSFTQILVIVKVIFPRTCGNSNQMSFKKNPNYKTNIWNRSNLSITGLNISKWLEFFSGLKRRSLIIWCPIPDFRY